MKKEWTQLKTKRLKFIIFTIQNIYSALWIKSITYAIVYAVLLNQGELGLQFYQNSSQREDV